jgi:proteasome lid subunit RPN8/RPN11
MKIRGVSSGLIELMCMIGAEQHPYEFAALLREEDGIISELILVPGTTSGEDHANVFLDMMPLGSHLAGSAHSHPNGIIRPSDADLNFFSRTGRFHFIIGYPYEKHNWRCFMTNGTPFDIEVVP